MSDMEENSAARADVGSNIDQIGSALSQGQLDSAATEGSSDQKGQVFENIKVQEISASLDEKSYVLGEVPQTNLADPQACLPLNSERLMGAGAIEKLMSESALLIQDEVSLINRFQRQVYIWEERIEKNKALLQEQSDKVKHNLIEISYDKKNRDFWLNRSEQVIMDYTHADALDRVQDWSWLIKKYGLKNPDGSPIDAKVHCISELCNGSVDSLASIYIAAGMKYDSAKKDKEQYNLRLITENGKLLKLNEQLQNYISNLYKTEIEPLQDGVLLLKEFSLKLRVLTEKVGSTYGELRMWAESFLDEFLKMNPNTPMRVVTEFRRLTSIPLPSQNS